MHKSILAVTVFSTMIMACAQVTTHQDPQKIKSLEDLSFPKGEKIENSHFVGTAYRQNIIKANNDASLSTTNLISFAPNSNSGWHRHGAMTVIADEGVGIYQAEGENAKILRRGDVVHIPAGVKHWHGSIEDSAFSQFVIYDATWKASENIKDQDDPVDYKTTIFEEYTPRN